MYDIHGDFAIEVDGNIIKFTAQGAFNDVGARAVIKGMKRAIASFNQNPFAILVNLLEFEGGTPEVFSEAERYNIWLNRQNLIAKAYIHKSEGMISIGQSLINSKNQQNIQYFATETEALHWLESELNDAVARTGQTIEQAY